MFIIYNIFSRNHIMEDNLENNIEGEKMIIEINDLENIEMKKQIK